MSGLESLGNNNVNRQGGNPPKVVLSQEEILAKTFFANSLFYKTVDKKDHKFSIGEYFQVRDQIEAEYKKTCNEKGIKSPLPLVEPTTKELKAYCVKDGNFSQSDAMDYSDKNKLIVGGILLDTDPDGLKQVTQNEDGTYNAEFTNGVKITYRDRSSEIGSDGYGYGGEISSNCIGKTIIDGAVPITKMEGTNESDHVVLRGYVAKLDDSIFKLKGGENKITREK